MHFCHEEALAILAAIPFTKFAFVSAKAKYHQVKNWLYPKSIIKTD